MYSTSTTDNDWRIIEPGQLWVVSEKLIKIHGFDIYGNKQTHVRKRIE